MGKAVAEELRAAGCRVAGVARSGGVWHLCDVTDAAQRAVMLSCLRTDLGSPDIVVHVTGGSMGLRDAMLPWEDYQKVLNLNLGAAHEINRSFVPTMVER